ncbi:MAG: hypothetical protein WC301_01610 [Candidatus Omnitrophota bacterium]
MTGEYKFSHGKGGIFVYVAAFFSALGGMLFGYDTGVISSAILFIKKDFMLSSGLQARLSLNKALFIL